MLAHRVVRGSWKGVLAEQPLLFPNVQLELHPSPSIVFPSSHCYEPATILSPQTVIQEPAGN